MNNMVDGICRELSIRADEAKDQINTIYFGGGTPSLLSEDQLNRIFDQIVQKYRVNPAAEITLEANPEDLTPGYLAGLSRLPVNRLSIGVQSFFDEDLVWMNRIHTANTAEASIRRAMDTGFQHLTFDLIYGLPDLPHQRWEQNLEKALSLQPDHLSAYCLTVEEHTALHHFVKQGKMPVPDDQHASAQFEMMLQILGKGGYEQYEISNFAKDGRYALHNTSYWKGESYIGIGPSAHSFNGRERSWNVANNARYLRSMENGIRLFESETLSNNNRFNEYIMTSLRTKWGCDTAYMAQEFPEYYSTVTDQIKRHIDTGMLIQNGSTLLLSPSGKLWADRIASDLFV